MGRRCWCLSQQPLVERQKCGLSRSPDCPLVLNLSLSPLRWWHYSGYHHANAGESDILRVTWQLPSPAGADWLPVDSAIVLRENSPPPRIMPLYAEEEGTHCSIVHWCGGRRFFSLAVSQILVQVLNFIIIKLLKFNALCTSAGSIIPLWIIKDSQIQFPPCWCHRAAEWIEKWMSPCWFTLLISQTSLLPPLRVREEKGQSSDSHKDLITMHVTAQPAPPARVTLWRKCHGCASLNTITGLLRQGHWCTREEEKHHRMTQKPI